ncbi:vpu protein [Human immunodeficiency virus 1]|uniref:Protein Vpu n=1 Tax=Human immunodeficiency virus type 1 group M subtype J (isolate SE9280) TaxID=388905 RepID=Q9WC59_HV1S2|nr:vpu protein [Human immunodeficiency virus 1]
MIPLQIAAIVAFIVAIFLAIGMWTIVYIEYKKLLRQRKIDKLIDRIRERAEDSGNESDGDTEELADLVERGPHDLWNVNDL